MKPVDAFSENNRTKNNEMIQNSVLSRQDGVGSARVMVVMQRLHEDDATGYLLARQPWRQVRLPAIAEEDEFFPYRDALGRQRVFKRKKGEALNPTYEPLEALEAQKVAVGAYYWASQYQLRPAPLDGGVFKIDRFRKLPRAQFPTQFDIVILSLDTASRDGLRNDYTVCFTIGVANGVRYVLDCFRAKLEFPQLRREVIRIRNHVQPNHIVIEAKGSGQELIPELRDLEVYGVEPALPTVSKVVRAEGQTAIIESGEVVFPSDADWLDDMLEEFALFPNGRHDDQVDALCQGLQWLRNKLHEPYMVAFARQEMEDAGLQPRRQLKETEQALGPDPVLPAAGQDSVRALPAKGWVRLKAPEGISHASGAGYNVLIPADRIVDVPESAALALLNAWPKKWERA